LRILYLLLFSLTSQIAVSQSFNGFIHSDFSGIIGSQLQPANIAGSPYKYDFSLLNGNFFLTNNIGYNTRTETGSGIIRYLERDQKFLHSNIGLGGFSGMLSLKGDEAIGFTYRLRAHASGIDFSPDVLIQFGRFTNPIFENTMVSDQKGIFTTSLWSEYALTYAKIISDDGFSRLKFGSSFKAIRPKANAFVRINDFDYETSSGMTTITNADLSFGYSSNLNDFEAFDGEFTLNGLPKAVGTRFASDVGFVFERIAFRADIKDESGTRLERDLNYEFKVSASITDIGTMKFEYGSASTRAFGAPTITNTNNLDLLLDSISSFRSFRDSLSIIVQTQGIAGNYTVSLPTALNLGYDYNFGNHFYFGAHLRMDLTSLLPVDYRLNFNHSITLSPRWEKQNKGVYVPVYVNHLGNLHVGLAARYGAITLGTQSIGALLSKEHNTLGFFFSLNINQLKANSKKPYCFGPSKGTAMTNTQRTPIYKRKKWIFF
jgi:hypothetical protein